jgi:hypothetical protein
MGDIAATAEDSNRNDSGDAAHFHDGDEDLNIAAGAHTHIVDDGEAENQRNGDQLSIMNLKQTAAGSNVVRNDGRRFGQRRNERGEIDIKARGEGSDRATFSYPELSPSKGP